MGKRITVVKSATEVALRGFLKSGAEAAFTTAFLAYIERNPHRRFLGGGQLFLQEAEAPVGIVDILGCRIALHRRSVEKLARLSQTASVYVDSTLLATITARRGADRPSLLSTMPFDRSTVRTRLDWLLSQKALRANKHGCLTVSSYVSASAIDLTFFELKMSKWQRALYQARQAQIYADRSYCVFPKTLSRVVKQNSKAFSLAGVGVVIFDATTGSATEVVRSVRRRKPRMSQKLQAILRAFRNLRGRQGRR